MRASVGSALPPVLAAQLPGAPLLMYTPTPNQPSQSNKEKRKASQLEHNGTRQAKNQKQKLSIPFTYCLKLLNLYYAMSLTTYSTPLHT